MPLVPGDPKEIAYYFSLAQVGLEMAVPIGVGAVIDHYAGSGPWGSIGGAVLGLVCGLTHLVVLANKQPDRKQGPGRDQKQ